MYKPLPSGLIIKDSGIEGQGVFTTRDLSVGCNLGESHYQIDEELIRTPLGGFINHSEEPNCHRTQVKIKPGFDKWTITVIKNSSWRRINFKIYYVCSKKHAYC